QLGGGEEVDLHHGAKHLLAARAEVPETADAGVVDQDVEPAKVIGGGVQQSSAVVIAGDVADEGQDIGAVRVQLPGQFVESVSGAGGDGHTGPFADGEAGEGPADAAGGTGDQHPFSLDDGSHDLSLSLHSF